MTPEQKQRIEQIRERHEQRISTMRGDGGAYISAIEAHADVADLLSMVKIDDEFVGPCVGCGHNNYNAEQKECAQRWMEGRMSVVCGCPCAKHNSLENAATSMRSACVEKVKAIWKRYHDDADKADKANDNINMLILLHKASAATEIARELESVTLQEQK